MKNILLSVLMISILFTLMTDIKAQNYVGSTTCIACHNSVDSKTGYNIAEEYLKSGHPYKLNKLNGAPPVFPANTSPGVNDVPDGTQWSDFAYMIGGYGWKARYVRNNGYVFTDNATAQFNLENGSRVAYNQGKNTKYDFSCFKCHTTGPSPEGSWTGVAADSMGTFSEPGIRCEGCHGPGSEHISNPTTNKLPNQDDVLKITRCGDCHQRGGVTNAIPSSGNYIEHHEQINEMRASKHGDGKGADLNCSSCHDSHIPLRYSGAAGNGLNAIKLNCQNCHADKSVKIKDALGNVIKDKPIDCIACHMAPAGKSAVGLQAGNGWRGDVKTHIFAINTSAVPRDSMFTADGKKVRLDANGLASVTMDYACLRCHTSENLDWAASYAGGIHSNGLVTGVNDIAAVPASFDLAQNYPNPFNPSTKIAFALPQTEEVRLAVYSITGQEVAVLIEDVMPAGNHTVTFNAENLASGVYIYKLNAGKFAVSRKMLLMR